MAKRNIKSISILIFLTVFCFTACEKEPDTNKQVSAIQNSAVTFYRAGMYYYLSFNMFLNTSVLVNSVTALESRACFLVV